MKTAEKSNSLIFKATKMIGERERLNVSIRLDDEHNNGHQDFAITGDTILNGRFDTGGCIHDTILKHFPELQQFVDLHLSDYSGAPMYAIANGFYHLKDKSKDNNKEVIMRYLRVTENEYSQLAQAEDKEHFGYILNQLKVPARWKKEAKKATKELEKLTGVKFINDSKRSNLDALNPKRAQEIKKRIKEGYYTPEHIQAREGEKQAKAKAKVIQELKDAAREGTDKINTELSVYLYLTENDIPTDNFIYYNHRNTGVFNWGDGAYSSYRTKMSESEFNAFYDKIDWNVLPEGIQFELKGVRENIGA